MAILFQCDRCRAITKQDLFSAEKPVKANTVWIKSHQMIDLCQACVESLHRFLQALPVIADKDPS